MPEKVKLSNKGTKDEKNKTKKTKQVIKNIRF